MEKKKMMKMIVHQRIHSWSLCSVRSASALIPPTSSSSSSISLVEKRDVGLQKSSVKNDDLFLEKYMKIILRKIMR
jgi:hypothetical protein